MQYIYLAHHGILGQKWGIRRFQNKDGSLTAAGRKRYSLKDVEKDFDDTIETHKDTYDSIISDGQKITEMADELSEDYANALKNVKLDSAAKNRIIKNLEDDFGSGCDDEDLYDMCLDDYAREEVDNQIGKIVKEKRQEFDDLQDRYWDNIHQLTSNIKDKYSDVKITDSYINNGSMAVNKYTGEKFDTAWTSYISRHFDDYWVYDTDEYYSAIERITDQLPSMEDYNKQHTLAHHGILGQKWGIRRFQNEDGSLTAAGRARYGYGEYKEASKEYKNARNKHDRGMMSEKKFEKATDRFNAKKHTYIRNITSGNIEDDEKKSEHNREVLKKVLIATAAVSAAAIVGYSAYSLGKMNADHIIKAGTKLRNINIGGISSLDDKTAFYNSRGLADNLKYKGWYANKKLAGMMDDIDVDVYESLIVPTSNIKIAGVKNASKVFNNLVKNDSEFADYVKEISDVALLDPNFKLANLANNIGAFSKSQKGNLANKNAYKLFNKRLVSADSHDIDMAKRFYNALSKEGYSGLADVNDRLFSGFGSKTADILFDKGPNYKITNRQMKTGKLFLQGGIGQLNLNARAYAPYVGLLGAISAAGAYADYMDQSKQFDKIVKDYRKDHPKSTLSYEDILENYYKEVPNK